MASDAARALSAGTLQCAVVMPTHADADADADAYAVVPGSRAGLRAGAAVRVDPCHAAIH